MVKVKTRQWILDSDCARYICGESQFLNIKKQKGGIVIIGNKTHHILGKDKIGNMISIDKVQFCSRS